ncbi:hypothetical protein GCM10025773_19730 [Microbacterium jejuense]
MPIAHDAAVQASAAPHAATPSEMESPITAIDPTCGCADAEDDGVGPVRVTAGEQAEVTATRTVVRTAVPTHRRQAVIATPRRAAGPSPRGR